MIPSSLRTTTTTITITSRKLWWLSSSSPSSSPSSTTSIIRRHNNLHTAPNTTYNQRGVVRTTSAILTKLESFSTSRSLWTFQNNPSLDQPTIYLHNHHKHYNHHNHHKHHPLFGCSSYGNGAISQNQLYNSFYPQLRLFGSVGSHSNHHNNDDDDNCNQNNNQNDTINDNNNINTSKNDWKQDKDILKKEEEQKDETQNMHLKLQNKMTKDKLQNILHQLGLSLRQWNIIRNSPIMEHHGTNIITTETQRQQDPIPSSSSNNNNNNSNNMKKRRKRKVISKEQLQPSNQNDVSYNKEQLYKRSLVTDKISARLRVRSIHAAQTIDIISVLTNIFGPMCPMPAVRHLFRKTSLIVQLPPSSSSPSSSSSSNRGVIDIDDDVNDTKSDVDAFFHPKSQPRYIAIFRYGSIVFFNVTPKDASYVLDQVKKYSTDSFARSFERKEHFEVALSPNMEQDAHVTSDFAIVKELTINNVAVLSTVMAQTVAFDSYNDVVDEMLATFDQINSIVTKTGNFTAMQKETLFKVVAQNNSLFIDMLAKLGIKDRSDTASWNNPQYEKIHMGMKHEFEIENRFEDIEFKLNLIQQNAKFFLEILHNQKTDTLEWIIIVLIAFECILMILEMSGLGEGLFDFLSFQQQSPVATPATSTTPSSEKN